MKKSSAAALMLISLMALLATGCRGQQTNPASSEAPNASGKPAAPSARAAESSKYDPVIELSTVAYHFPTIKYTDGDDSNNNPWTRHIEKKLGIKVKTDWAVLITEYEKKSNLMIAGGALPDFFQATPDQFKQLYDEGMLEEMTEVYDKQASGLVKKVIADAGPEVLKSAVLDGKLMAIPFTGVAKELPPILWIRADWKTKLQLPDPQTMDDLNAIADAFTHRDPDGNGKDDTFGLALDKDLLMATGFFNGYRAYSDIWLKDSSGKLAYSTIQPEMKQALASLQRMFMNGLIDPEFAIKPIARVHESIGAGKLGMMIGERGSASFPLAALTPQQEWIAYPIPTVDGKPALAQLPLNIYNYYWVVRKGTKHPEAILKLMDEWLNAYYHTKTEEEYRALIVSETNSSIWQNAPAKLYLADNNIETYRQVSAVLQGRKQARELSPERKNMYNQVRKYLAGDKTFWGPHAQNGIGGSASIVDAIMKENRFLADEFYTTPTESMVEKGENLKKLQTETFVNMISGAASIDEFDHFVESWGKLGGNQMTQEVNEWYVAQR